MSLSDKQYDGMLIDAYVMLNRIKAIALEANDNKVLKAIDDEMNVIKLKLQPTKLPD